MLTKPRPRLHPGRAQKIHSLQLAFLGKQVIVQFLLCLSELYWVTYPPNAFTQHKSFSRLHRGYGNKLLKFTIFEKNNRETFGPLDQRLIDTLRDNLSQWAIENVSNMLTAGTHGYDF